MNITKPKKCSLEKEFDLLITEAFAEIENATGERTPNAESIKIELGLLPNDIGGKYLFKFFNSEGRVTLNAADVLHSYDHGTERDAQALRKDLLPIIAHECMHHLFYTSSKIRMHHRDNWIAEGFEEAPAYFIEYYIAAKIFEEGDGYAKMLKNIKSTTENNTDANWIRAGIVWGLCKMPLYTTDHYTSIALKLADIRNAANEGYNETSKISAAEIGRAISLTLFAANDFNILKTMHELNAPWQDAFYSFSRKLGEAGHFRDAMNKLNEIGKMHAKINHMWWCTKIYGEKCTKNIKGKLRFSDAITSIGSLLREGNDSAQSKQTKN